MTSFLEEPQLQRHSTTESRGVWFLSLQDWKVKLWVQGTTGVCVGQTCTLSLRGLVIIPTILCWLLLVSRVMPTVLIRYASGCDAGCVSGCTSPQVLTPGENTCDVDTDASSGARIGTRAQCTTFSVTPPISSSASPTPYPSPLLVWTLVSIMTTLFATVVVS